jgi:hypothetical protein
MAYRTIAYRSSHPQAIFSVGSITLLGTCTHSPDTRVRSPDDSNPKVGNPMTPGPPPSRFRAQPTIQPEFRFDYPLR